MIVTWLVIAVTMLGSKVFLVAVVLVTYWCIDADAGYWAGISYLSSMWLNSVLKLTFRLPRPGDQVRPGSGWFIDAEGYGFPSGHTQGTATTWGFFAGISQSERMLRLALFLTVAVAVSRVYLKAHFISDCVGGAAAGWAVAAVFVAVYRVWHDRRVPLAAVVPLSLLMLLGPLDEAVVKSSGFFAGFAGGAAFQPRVAPLRRPDGWSGGMARAFMGLLLIVGLWLIVERVGGLGPGVQWVGHAVLGAVASLGVPAAFVRLGR